MSKTNQLSEGIALQTHVKTAQTLKTDTTLVNLIKQVLSAPDVFVFGELLAVDPIRALAKKGGEAQQHFDLLEIFAYGSYNDYKVKQNELPKLTDKQAKKLKQLTIASLASDNHVIPYSLLLKELDISELRELEDLVIDALYKDIVVGKLDHERKVFQVDSAIGRDLRPGDMDKMISTLQSWQKQSETLLKKIDDSIKDAQARRNEVQNHKRDFEKRLEEAKGHVKIVMENEMAGGIEPDILMGGEMAMMGLMDRGGHGGRQKQKNRGRQHMT